MVAIILNKCLISASAFSIICEIGFASPIGQYIFPQNPAPRLKITLWRIHMVGELVICTKGLYYIISYVISNMYAVII